MYELLAAGLVNIAQVKYLLPLFLGTLAGVVGGALPGVTITMTIIVVLPFTFGLDPLQGLAGWSRRCCSASREPPQQSPPSSTAIRWRRRASRAAQSGSASGRRSSAVSSAACF